MAREVEHDADGPYVLTEADVDPEHGDIAVCRCGLSAEFPFCDGSHRAARDEAAGTRYRYPDGPDGEREVVRGVRTRVDDDGARQSDEVGSRLVTHDAVKPTIVDPEDLDTAGGRIPVCRCGLSAAGALCDDSHTVCSDERPGRVYRYEGDGERRVVEAVETTEE